MKSKRRPQHDEIRELLRRGDPAGDGQGLDPEETARMRRRIVAEPATRRASVFRPLPAFAAAALVVLMVAVGWKVMRSELPPAPDGTDSVTVPGPGDTGRRLRQVQFSTPGGTRIIWLLDSEFEV